MLTNHDCLLVILAFDGRESLNPRQICERLRTVAAAFPEALAPEARHVADYGDPILATRLAGDLEALLRRGLVERRTNGGYRITSAGLIRAARPSGTAPRALVDALCEPIPA